MRKSELMESVQQKFCQLSKSLKGELRTSAMRHRNVDYCLRCKVILNLVRGNRPSSIRRHLGCSASSVTRIMHRFIENSIGGLNDGRSDNGERKITEEHEEFLLQASAASPIDFEFHRTTWTLELFIKLLEKTFSITVAKSTMSRLLNSLWISRKRPKPFLNCPWPKALKNRRLNKIAKIVKTAGKDEVIVYVDEVDIHLNPKIGSDWMPNGMQKQVLTPGKNEKRYLAGALNARSGRVTVVEGDRKNSDLFVKQLWTLVKEDYPDAKHIHLILDNYSIHHSNLTKTAVGALSEKLSLHFLPPYCPDHNRIERLWKDLHDSVTRNHPWATMDELMKAVRKFIQQRNKNLANAV